VEVSGNGKGTVSAIGIANCGGEPLPRYSEIQTCLLIEPEDGELFDGGVYNACEDSYSGYNQNKPAEARGLNGSLIASVSTQYEGETAYYGWAWFWMPGGHKGVAHPNGRKGPGGAVRPNSTRSPNGPKSLMGSFRLFRPRTERRTVFRTCPRHHRALNTTGVTLVVIGLAIGGCGGPTASTRSFGGRVSDGTRRFNLTNPLRRHPAGVVVASDSLPDGVATFFGRMYRSSGRAYFILATEVEEATTHGLVAVSGGTRSLGAREYQTAALTIKHGCLAGHQFGLV
jgi:hypothetical protein